MSRLLRNAVCLRRSWRSRRRLQAPQLRAVLALLADGTLVVWLVLGLSVEPRCAPKLMIWATLPQVLPPAQRILSGAAYCNFETLGPQQNMPAGVDAGATGAMPQRAA